MNDNTLTQLLQAFFNDAVNQALIRRENTCGILPQDQQEAINKILNAIHEINENQKIIFQEYRPQAWDAMILKLAAEIGYYNGGTNRDYTGNRF